jgi:hypothetical protein
MLSKFGTVIARGNDPQLCKELLARILHKEKRTKNVLYGWSKNDRIVKSFWGYWVFCFDAAYLL